MVIQCLTCELYFDDAECTTICPHVERLPLWQMKRQALALPLMDKMVRFAHMPKGSPTYRVHDVSWAGLVTLEGMAGEYAPHLFVVEE